MRYAPTVMDAKNHWSGKPDGAAFQWLWVIGYWLLKREFDTLVGNGCVAAPARPNKKNNAQDRFLSFYDYHFMTNFLEIWLRRALFTTDQKTCCGKQKNISYEKLAQKLTIQSRIVNVLDTTL